MIHECGLSEYKAFLESKNRFDEIYDMYNIELEKINHNVTHIKEFNDYYNYNKNNDALTENDREKVPIIINNCMMKIHNGMKPTNSMEASIMYDMCCIMKLESGEFTEQECANLLNAETKQNNLSHFGFNLPYHLIKQIEQILKNEDVLTYMVKPENLEPRIKDENILKNSLNFVLTVKGYSENYNDQKYETANKIINEFIENNKEYIKIYCSKNAVNICQNEQLRKGTDMIFGKEFLEEEKTLIKSVDDMIKEIQANGLYVEENELIPIEENNKGEQNIYDLDEEDIEL